MCCLAAVVEDNVFFSLGVLKYVVCLCKWCDGCCVVCLYCNLLMLVEDARGHHMEETYSRAGLMTAL